MITELIRQIRSGPEGRDSAIRQMYTDDSIRKIVIGTLRKMGCSESKAKDCFTDAIVSFVKSCNRIDFMIHTSISNYLTGTAKHMWFKEVTKKRKEHTIVDNDGQVAEAAVDDNLIKAERKALLYQLLDELDDTCRQVLLLWAQNLNMKKIATSMAYKSEGMARKKKHQCLRKLYDIVARNPHIKQDLSSE